MELLIRQLMGFAFISVLFLLIYYLLFLRGNYVARKIEAAGRKGEINASSFLHTLSDEYRVFNNVIIDGDGTFTEIDNVVVGPSGVFIVEVKNYRGKIYGKENDKHFLQTKRAKFSGRKYRNRIGNPIKQVKRQIYYLSGLLKKSKIHIHINGVVLFTEKSVSLSVKSSNIPVLRLRGLSNMGFEMFMEEFGNSKLSKERINEISKVIIKEMEDDITLSY